MKNLDKTITRKQLCSLGTTQYQAKALTKLLTPINREGRAYAYSIRDVVASIREYAQRSRIQSRTRDRLEEVLKLLLPLLDNVIAFAPGESSDPELKSEVKKLLAAMRKTDATLAGMKLEAAGIEAKYVNESL